MDRAAILFLYICTKFWDSSTFICSCQELNRIYDINRSAQKGSMNCRVQQAYRYRNQSIFTMFFINLKQDLKKYVQPRASVMADLFTLPYSVYSVLLADNTQRLNS
jgi:hypothetical protein